jgi:hypothetical protein
VRFPLGSDERKRIETRPDKTAGPRLNPFVGFALTARVNSFALPAVYGWQDAGRSAGLPVH